MRAALLFVLCLLTVAGAEAAKPDALTALPAGVINSQKVGENPLPPLQSLAKITAPEGFRVSLFAGEPDVRQPIAMEIDDRGRLWVAECYAYRTWKAKGVDRLLIFEDTDNDGVFDKRKVFWDEGNYLTGFQLGFGGVWICCAPKLMFIPDRDGDDKPDSKPEVLLDGWSNKGVHNVVNGLSWGPDGWLYGCNGITAPSLVGKPGTPKEDRTEVSCAVWRYHPQKQDFEVVAHGTTNPWGIDWDAHGQAFSTNCVIEHLFHLVPGGHYKRMFGEDLNPYSYGLMNACSDHLHWAGKEWTKARGGDQHDKLGGGHAHCGAMIYQGDNWPHKYRGTLFTCNLHGNRVNNDTLHRSRSGFTARHSDDFLYGNDPWFRGVELKYGPGGEVYVSDWSDFGECHDRDGVHRDSGRIYRVVFGASPVRKTVDLQKQTDAQLVEYHSHENAYFARHSSRILQERAARGELSKETNARLRRLFAEAATPALKLRAMWTLHNCQLYTKADLQQQLDHASDDVRWWAVQLLVEDRQADKEVVAKFAAMAATDKSPLVRLSLASALQRLPVESRLAIATALAAHEEDANDPNLPLMIWYGIEPAVKPHPGPALKLAKETRIPLLRRFIARRLTEK